jgi:outer membrane immunogenic protein
LSETTHFTKSGWVVGGGAEMRIAGPWSAKVEYLYMDLGSLSDALTVAGISVFGTNSSFHDNIVRGGLNYKFWAGSASGTPDHPALVYKAPARQPAVYEWTGFYAGINGGYGIARDPINQNEYTAGLTSTIDSRILPQGRLIGGQLGYNFQTGHIVYGVEGDLQWADQNDTACGLACFSIPGGFGVTIDAEQRLTWFGTARARLGYADNGWLFYVTGGGAWGGIDETQTEAASLGGIALSFSNTSHFTKSGWVLGGGTEVPIIGPWSAKVEYLYMDLGSITDTFSILGLNAKLTANSSVHDNIVRAGLNYKLNWGGPVY